VNEPQIVVERISHVVPVVVLGEDEHGRTLIQCPARGCGDTAHIADDGQVVCPTGTELLNLLRQAGSALDQALGIAEPTA